MLNATFLSSIICSFEYCILSIHEEVFPSILSLALHFLKENNGNNIFSLF